MKRSLLLPLILLAIGPAARSESLVILSLNKDKKIDVYSLSEKDGSLALESSTPSVGNPGALCVAPDGRHLYAGMRGTGTIAAYRIEENATLTPLGETQVGEDAAYLSVHRSGEYLLSAYYGGGQVAVHRIGPDGALSQTPLQQFKTDERAHAAVFDPSGNFVFVPHTTPNAIHQFRFDPTTGTLAPNDPAKLIREPNSGPRHLWFHPNNGYAYGSDEQGRSATAYRFDPTSGTLAVSQTLTSLPPEGFAEKSSTSDIEVHPSGKFVYIANRGYNAIVGYRIDNATGQMTTFQHAPTEAVTRSFNISPDGRHLVAAGQQSGKLAVFRIAADGALERRSTTIAGVNPWWVQIVERPAIHLGQGTLSGEVTASTAMIQTRLTAAAALNAQGDLPGAPGVAAFEWSQREDFQNARRTSFKKAAAANDFIVREELIQLRPDTRYYYRALYGADERSAKHGPVSSFKTLPGAASGQAVTFIVGSCMNYNKFMHGKAGKASGPLSATEEDKRLGFPAFAAMKDVRPDFFVGTGDIVYYDNPYRVAETLEQLRLCWHEQFRFPRMVDFFQNVPAYWSKDDHDFRFNDSDNASDRLPLPQTGIDLFREQLPIVYGSDRSGTTYRTHRVNRHLQIWLTEGRDFRSPNDMQDGPNKTLWGTEQKAWLQRTLKASDAKWKLIITPTPMVGPDDAYKKDNHANLEGFRHEADAFFQWLKDNDIQNVTTICGDRHWQYHSIHPSGIEEFACGALNDENSRRGVPPGDPKGTDPNALVKQPFISPKPSGGFLVVTAGERLSFEIRAATGKTLYQITK